MTPRRPESRLRPSQSHGTSLWQDAWRRLLRNRLARGRHGRRRRHRRSRRSSGPPIIERTTGYTYDYIPSDRDADPLVSAVHGA